MSFTTWGRPCAGAAVAVHRSRYLWRGRRALGWLRAPEQGMSRPLVDDTAVSAAPRSTCTGEQGLGSQSRKE